EELVEQVLKFRCSLPIVDVPAELTNDEYSSVGHHLSGDARNVTRCGRMKGCTLTGAHNTVPEWIDLLGDDVYAGCLRGIRRIRHEQRASILIKMAIIHLLDVLSDFLHPGGHAVSV